MLAVLAAAGGWSAQAATRSLTILHTNDLHARLLPDDSDRGGFACLAGVIRREREGAPGVLVLDAGDLVQGTPVSTIFRGIPIYEIANRVGLDVTTLGNHEFDYGWETISEFRQAAGFPIVSANVVDADGRFLADAPFTVRVVNGIRVAILGVLTRDLPHLVVREKIGPWRVAPVVRTVKDHVDGLRGRVDLIVVLGHLTESEEDALLAEVPEVAVVVSGHRHNGLDEPKRAGKRMVVRVRAYGRELGRLDLAVDIETGAVVSSTWKRIPVDAREDPEAEDVAERVAHWESRVSDIVDVPIGESRRALSRAETREMIERVMAEATGADLAFLGEGAVRDTLPAGRLLARHVWNVMPFDDKVVLIKTKGRELPRFVTAGRAVDPDRAYTLALTDFTAAMHPETRSAVIPSAGGDVLVRDLLIDWIRKREVLP